MNEYSTSTQAPRGLFLAGITYYRLSNFEKAKTTFQRYMLLATNAADQAEGYLWIGKSQMALNDPDNARVSWDMATQKDPTGYFSERARELLSNKSPFTTTAQYDLGYDLEKEKQLAESWMKAFFSIPSNTNLADMGPLANEARFKRGTAYWQLGLYREAQLEFESLRNDLKADVANTYRLVNHLLNLGVYRSAILGARQILDAAGMDDAGTLGAPVYFSHIRFGAFYKDIVVSAAQSEKFNPLFLFSVIRQESMFESFAQSGVGAQGLMQIMPATGKEISDQLGWPEKYSDTDLDRAFVNIRLGADYMAKWRDYFDGDLYAALASYNGGPGNTIAWKELAPSDPDLFLEVIRADETRNYIMYVFEFFQINRLIYERIP